MQEDRAGFLEWVKIHKKELVIAGISITAIIGVILGIKTRSSIIRMWESLQQAITKQPLKPDGVKSMHFTPCSIPSVPVINVVPAKEITVISKTGIGKSSFDVNGHLRNLHEGWQASATKISTAAEHGFDLQPGQTWVDSFTKGGLVA